MPGNRIKRIFAKGSIIGYWTVVSDPVTVPTNYGSYIAYACRCECGTERMVRSSALLTNGPHASTSCGCYCKLRVKITHTKHGMCKRPEYAVWGAMKERCFVPTSQQFKDYGARGITVAEEWRVSFKAFYDYIGPRPTKLHSLDRVDNDGNYEPGNVRWATKHEQSNNRRNNVFYEHDGKSMTLHEWAAHLGLGRETLRGRIRKGWPLHLAFNPELFKPRARRKNGYL